MQKGSCRWLSAVLSSRHGVWNVFRYAVYVMVDHNI